MLEFNWESNFKSFLISLNLDGKKPQKKYFSENPLIDTAVLTAEGPGNGKIFIFSLTHSLTKMAPGSDIPGVPASETRDIILVLYNYDCKP